MVEKDFSMKSERIWFTPDETKDVKDFISKLQDPWATNVAVAGIVVKALRNPAMREVLAKELNADPRFMFRVEGLKKRKREHELTLKQKLSNLDITKLLCKNCGFKAKTVEGLEIHAEKVCGKRPLEVVIRR